MIAWPGGAQKLIPEACRPPPGTVGWFAVHRTLSGPSFKLAEQGILESRHAYSGPELNRDFSRFSEDRPTHTEYGFWPVTCVCVCPDHHHHAQG